jgi:putative NADH-flavin reductase
MRLAVLGATGGIGNHLIAQALDTGHEVVAVVRDPARLRTDRTPGLTVKIVESLQPESLIDAFTGADAVVSALGPRGGGRQTVLEDGARGALAAMDKVRIRRYVVVSADGAYANSGDGPILRRVVKPILQRALRDAYADVDAMEQLVRASDVDWTIVRPTRLVDTSLTGRYRTAVDKSVRRGLKISRADVAHAILGVLGDEDAVGHVVSVAY